MHYELPDGSVVRFYHAAVDAIMAGAASVYERETGRTFTREGVIAALGYEGAKRRGVFDEYCKIQRLKGIA